LLDRHGGIPRYRSRGGVACQDDLVAGASFDDIAGRYEGDSLVQRAASEVLLDLLVIDSDEAVLDLGCGTGHLTRVLARLTAGLVEGADLSAPMIEAAEAGAADAGMAGRVHFRQCAAEDLDAVDRYDVVF
jgi:2-polyprenyl-3-methyl-5-hydroxy-6-metoxy-1,4-benzoquinol methylase